MHAEEPPKPGDESAVYAGENIRIQQYGDTAIVAFHLVATFDRAGAKSVSHYLNPGIFLKRAGKWQTVAWQATAMPEKAEPESQPATSER